MMSIGFWEEAQLCGNESEWIEKKKQTHTYMKKVHIYNKRKTDKCIIINLVVINANNHAKRK